jgi:hypothetical protein
MEVLTVLGHQQSQATTQMALMYQLLGAVNTNETQATAILSSLDSQAVVASRTMTGVQRLVAPLTVPTIEFSCEISADRERSGTLLAALRSIIARADSPTKLNSGIGVSSAAKADYETEPPTRFPTPKGLPLPAALFSFLAHPTLEVRLYSASNKIRRFSRPDLLAVSTNLTRPPEFRCNLESNILQCHWWFTVSTRGFHPTANLFSIPDLPLSQVRACIPNAPPEIAGALVPRRLELRFDSVTVTLTTLSNLPPAQPTGATSTAVRPSATNTLSASPETLDDADYSPQESIAFASEVPLLAKITAETDQRSSQGAAVEVMTALPLSRTNPPRPSPPTNLRVIFSQ